MLLRHQPHVQDAYLLSKMAGDRGPNKRGKASRSGDRNTRYATHIPVLKACIGAMSATALNPIYVIEHGMGLGSTPFFHSVHNVASITSFEREPGWLFCNDCLSGSTQPHSITLLHDQTILNQAKSCVTVPERTVGLVDGYVKQRLPMLETWMSLGMAFIVEHDADAFTGPEIRSRQKAAKAFGYAAYQYADHDPETAFFVSPGAQLSLTGSCAKL